MELMELNIKHCPSCGKVHHSLLFVQAGAQFRATCPFTGEVITLAAVRKQPGPSEVKHGA